MSSSDVLGKPSAWIFGITGCLRSCSVALAEMSAIMNALGDDAEKLNVLFVSTNPAKDTPAGLKRFMSSFDRRIVALTGDPVTIDWMAKEGLASPAIHSNTDVLQGHDVRIQLADADGEFVETLCGHETMGLKMARLRNLLELR